MTPLTWKSHKEAVIAKEKDFCGERMQNTA